MKNVIQYYKWGRQDFIPSLLGIKPEPNREYAELWMGAHPNGSSVLEMNGQDRPLVDLVREQPQRWLGTEVHDQYGVHFPFLLKVLSINTALSIQVHPAAWQAAEGYRQEEDHGIAADSPTRLYKDTHHKPELICALTPVWAMCGFRQQKEIEKEFRLPHYEPLHERINGPLAIEKLFPLLLKVNDEDKELRIRLLQNCAAHITSLHPDLNSTVRTHAVPPNDITPDIWAYWWVLRLMRQFPDDLGALAPLYLNLFLLDRTDGLYIGARTPHAYLFGNGVEIMANSDNVLRCGLSQKHIDANELLRVVNLSRSDYQHVAARESSSGVIEYLTPAAEFKLVVIDCNSRNPLGIEHASMPKILLCTDGEVTVCHGNIDHNHADISGVPKGKPSTLARGQSLFCPPDSDPVTIEGNGKVYMGIPATEVRYYPVH